MDMLAAAEKPEAKWDADGDGQSAASHSGPGCS
jgi:hypothetical protein